MHIGLRTLQSQDCKLRLYVYGGMNNYLTTIQIVKEFDAGVCRGILHEYIEVLIFSILL